MHAASKYRRVIVWMRRALRVDDHAPLWHAKQDADEVIPLLVLRDDPAHESDTLRRRFVRQAIVDLDARLREHGSRLHVRVGNPDQELPAAALEYGASAVYAAALYDTPGLQRDAAISARLRNTGVAFCTFKDRILRESGEVRTSNGQPYRVFTPYKNTWLAMADDLPRPFPEVRRVAGVTLAPGSTTIDRLWGRTLPPPFKGDAKPAQRLKTFLSSAAFTYSTGRDQPAIDGTSKLSHHLALGTISPRRVYWAARDAFRAASTRDHRSIETFIVELIWREFYYHILSSYPFVLDVAFKEGFRNISWQRSTSAFERWKRGDTGYPIVDAGMRQLSTEGWMHNRVRMIVASFLTKDLHIDWRWGEKHFADLLVDLDLASNNGGWQWTAGTGTDASPWFRIFNPTGQAKKFDPTGDYVRRYVPELARIPAPRIHEPWLLPRQDQEACGCIIGRHYPKKIVEHADARERTISLYTRIGKQ